MICQDENEKENCSLQNPVISNDRKNPKQYTTPLKMRSINLLQSPREGNISSKRNSLQTSTSFQKISSSDNLEEFVVYDTGTSKQVEQDKENKSPEINCHASPLPPLIPLNNIPQTTLVSNHEIWNNYPSQGENEFHTPLSPIQPSSLHQSPLHLDTSDITVSDNDNSSDDISADQSSLNRELDDLESIIEEVFDHVRSTTEIGQKSSQISLLPSALELQREHIQQLQEKIASNHIDMSELSLSSQEPEEDDISLESLDISNSSVPKIESNDVRQLANINPQPRYQKYFALSTFLGIVAVIWGMIEIAKFHFIQPTPSTSIMQNPESEFIINFTTRPINQIPYDFLILFEEFCDVQDDSQRNLNSNKFVDFTRASILKNPSPLNFQNILQTNKFTISNPRPLSRYPLPSETVRQQVVQIIQTHHILFMQQRSQQNKSLLIKNFPRIFIFFLKCLRSYLKRLDRRR